MKVKAGALFLVIVVALAISLLTSALILLAYSNRLYAIQVRQAARLLTNADSGINLLLSGSYSIDYNTTKPIDLFGDENDSVSLKKMHWGLFEVGVSKAFSGSKSVSKIIQFGYNPDTLSNAAIYLVDMGRPLSVSGNTIINGTAYLPEAGIKRAYIEGASFSGNQLVNGAIMKSNGKLPSLNKPILDRLLTYFQAGKSYKQNCIVENNLQKDTLIRSYADTTLLVQFYGPKEISSAIIKGNIILYSDTIIIIDASTQLNDVLICASSVLVKSGFKGNLQIFCTDSIVVEANCQLDYPSALGIFKMDYKTMQPFIRVGNNSTVKGILFSYQNASDLKQTKITLSQSSLLEGEAYVDGFFEADGTVNGSVTCTKFLLNTPSAVYENYLLNAVIDIKKRSKYYVGSGMINTGNEKEMVKWLY